MFRFLGLRLVHTLPVIIGITLAAFVLIHAVPGDPIPDRSHGKASQEHIDEVESQLGIDRPLPEQYARFVVGIPQGDLGTSIILRRPVSSVIGERLQADGAPPHLCNPHRCRPRAPSPGSPRLSGATVWALVRLLTLVAFAMPAFWLGLILIPVPLDLRPFPYPATATASWITCAT